MTQSHEKANLGKLIFTLGGLAALGPLSIDMYLPAFPSIQRELQTTPGMLSATIGTFFIGLCVGQLIYGPMSDRIGRRKPLLFGIALYAVATVGCVLTTSIEGLLMLRCFQALGSCAGMVVGRALVRDLFAPTETARVFSMIMLVMGIAPVLAPLVGQWIATTLGWRAIFAVTAVFSVIVWFASYLLIPGGTSPLKKTSSPPLVTYWSLLKDRSFMSYALAGTFIQAGLFAYITGSPILIMTHLGLGSSSFSLIFGLNALGLIIASQLNNWLLKRYGYREVMGVVIKAAVASSAMLLLSGLSRNNDPLTTLIPLFLFVASLGFVFPNSTAGALARQSHRAGSASALLGTVQYGGAAIASLTVGWLSHATPAAMEIVIAVCAVASLICYAVLLPSNSGEPLALEAGAA